MQIVVVGTAEAQKEFQEKGISEGVEIHFETTVGEVNSNAAAYFYLLSEAKLAEDLALFQSYAKPVFAHAILATREQLPQNFIRINGWPTFLQRSVIEIACRKEILLAASNALNAIGWNFKTVADIPGMIAARVIAMIVNEAYFALEDEVSSKEDIDVAMKLGTNYPYGPFEWSEKIGLQNIAGLLVHLAKTDKRYVPSEALLKNIKR
jgi:3-hydroxybutyryl-CoA dehydrogenase